MRRREKRRRPWSRESICAYTQARIGRAAAVNRRSLGEFAEWLSQSRGQAPKTINQRVHSACTFVDEMTLQLGKPCAEAFRSITPKTIEEYFVAYGRERGMSARRSMRLAMRQFLLFASSRGWVERELASVVPRLMSYSLSRVPRRVREEQLSRLLETPFRGGRCCRRDRALLFLLAAYGPRCGQLSALRLVDIDWHERVIRFERHKGGKSVEHTLTDAVAQTLAEYLHDERPQSEDESVFLRSVPPHTQLSPGAITAAVNARMVACGLSPLGAHAFRHAFATRLLRAGQTSKTIADLLGHRSLSAVAIYAKLDHPRLLEVAAEWPEAL